jgi:hypothetical protein
MKQVVTDQQSVLRLCEGIGETHFDPDSEKERKGERRSVL